MTQTRKATKTARIVLLGAPGAGKGTQAKLLADTLGVPHVASGDLFRKHQAEGTDLGKLAKLYMEKGELVPDQVTIQMVLQRISEPDATKGYILDGFPRTLDQARALDEALKQKSIEISVAPLIDVDTEELVRRLSGRWVCTNCQTPYHTQSAPPKKMGVCDRCGGALYQRADDKPEVVRNRLQTYERQTEPLIEYYAKQGKLRRIKGEQSIDQVTQDLLGAVQST